MLQANIYTVEEYMEMSNSTQEELGYFHNYDMNNVSHIMCFGENDCLVTHTGEYRLATEKEPIVSHSIIDILSYLSANN